MKTELEIISTIKELSTQIEVPCNLVDIGITLSKMSAEQQQDLWGMIEYFNRTKAEPGYILANVMHDINGLKAGFLGLPEGICFSPRSHGYAKKVS